MTEHMLHRDIHEEEIKEDEPQNGFNKVQDIAIVDIVIK